MLFWHRLALQLGYTVEDLQRRMSSDEFTRWIAYAGIEHFGYPMDNWRMGVQTAQLVNVIRSTIPRRKGAPRPKPAQPSDFFPASKRKPTVELTAKQRAHITRRRTRRKRNG